MDTITPYLMEVINLTDTTKYCANCGILIEDDAEFCPDCGVKQLIIQKEVKEIKNPGLAAVFSFLVVGLGQIYNGQIAKGLLLLVGAVISGILMIILIGFVFWIIIWIYAIYDAYNTAKRINSGEINT